VSILRAPDESHSDDGPGNYVYPRVGFHTIGPLGMLTKKDDEESGTLLVAVNLSRYSYPDGLTKKKRKGDGEREKKQMQK
jgi:hypothetical protein